MSRRHGRRLRLAWRWVLVGFLVAALAVAAVLGLAARSALTAARTMEDARAAVSALRDPAATAEGASSALDQAAIQLADAERELSRPAVDVVAAVPLLGRSLRAQRAVLATALAVVNGVRAALAQAPELRSSTGGFDLEAVRALAARLDTDSTRAEQALRDLRATRVGLTPPVVQHGVRDAESTLAPVVDGLLQGARAAGVLPALLGRDGTRHVLVALENNAELRGTGGYVSTYALGTLRQGGMVLQPFRDVVEVADAPSRARRVQAAPAFAEDYGVFLADTTLWRNWTMSPDVPASAAVGAQVAGELLGRTPDMVLLLDVPALASVMRLSGANVALDGRTTVSPDELTEALLVDSYARAGDSEANQAARRAALRAAATRAVTRLVQSDIATLDGMRTFARLARGRHVAVWSAQAEEQAELTRLGVAGSIPTSGEDLALISVNNLNANKLDYYVDRRVTVEATVHHDVVEVVQTVRLHNRAPRDLVPYVAGSRSPGTVQERLELSVSPRASVRSLTTDGAPAAGTVRVDAQRTRVATFLTLPRGERVTVQLRYDVPVVGGRYRLHLVPQPLARDALLQVRLRAADGATLQSVKGVPFREAVVDHTAAWEEQHVVEARLTPVGRWERLRQRVADFWTSPVSY